MKNETIESVATEAGSAMQSLIKKGLGNDGVDPYREFVGGAYAQKIEFARVEREKYVGEVGKHEGNYIYHFFPRTFDILPQFGDKLGDAMLKVFKYPERLAAKHDEVMRCFEGEEGAEKDPSTPVCRWWGTPEDFPEGKCPNCGSGRVAVSMSSWAVKVSGYADNPLADELAASVFDVLDGLL